MANKEAIAIPADPDDADDFDVSETALAAALADRNDRRERAKGGRPRGSTKQLVSLRIDTDTLERYRATGAGWQSRINEALRRVAP